MKLPDEFCIGMRVDVLAEGALTKRIDVRVSYARITRTSCLGVLAVILIAGLWPFYAPANQVAWLKTGSGIELGKHGSLISSSAFKVGERADPGATIEIWLQPANSSKGGTILSFAGPQHPGEPLSLLQDATAFSIRRNNVDPRGISHTALFHVNGVFQANSPVFVTVVLDSLDILVYVNGSFAAMFPHSRAWNDLTGKLILANSYAANYSWAGSIFRLAMYQQKLTASQIAADYTNWKNGETSVANGKSAIALYLFDEHRGTIAHNRVHSSTDLSIPARYFISDPPCLRVPWREYQPSLAYWKDVAVNVSGFVPFGMTVFAYLASIRVVRYPGSTTVLLGALLSLAIELVQTLLPTRSSGMTDLIMNTLGTAIGMLVSRHYMGRILSIKRNRVPR